MVKCLPESEYFYCVLEKTNIIFKIRRSKVSDYAALNELWKRDKMRVLLYLLRARMCNFIYHNDDITLKSHF